jgi:three-Cys-motif partner protein
MPTPKFGGSWTQRKLEVIRRYLDLYATALKRQPFKRLYVDAFAGTGARTEKRAAAQLLLDLPELDAVTKGSARLALEVNPPFDEYKLIEKAQRRAGELEKLKADHPHRVVTIINDDANDAIAQICRVTDWRSTRGVVFLDPFGMQVSWVTLVVLAESKACDVWLLVPTGMGLRRLLTRDGDIPQEWQDTLDRFLGTKDWRTEFYRIEESTDLLGDPVKTQVRDVALDKLEQFVLDRLRTIFPVVMERGVSLTNSKGQAMYLLCFASANPSPKVKELALKLARWAMKA